MQFHRGQRVRVKRGDGTTALGQVAYQRLAPPDYLDAEAVSVYLDQKTNQPGYAGTIFSAKDVEPEDQERPSKEETS